MHLNSNTNMMLQSQCEIHGIHAANVKSAQTRSGHALIRLWFMEPIVAKSRVKRLSEEFTPATRLPEFISIDSAVFFLARLVSSRNGGQTTLGNEAHICQILRAASSTTLRMPGNGNNPSRERKTTERGPNIYCHGSIVRRLFMDLTCS